ncbi:MAG: pyruvate formate lyase-activating protein [Cyanobacteria bacterium P01_H01_bin.105]
MPKFKPLSSQQVRCPHCGAIAERYFLDISQLSEQLAHRCAADDFVTRTVCEQCDYLMMLCTKSDAVLEAYMAGF